MVSVAAPGGRTRSPEGLSGLLRTIESARRRAILAASIETGVTALAAGLIVYCAMQGAAVAGATTVAAPVSIWAGAIVTVAALVIGAASAWAIRPDASAMCRRADALFGLAERLSTTMQLARSAPVSDAVVPNAQIHDALRRSEVVDPRRLAPLRMPIASVAVVILAVIALLLGSAADVEGSGDGGTAPRAQLPSGEMEVADRAALAAAIDEIAARIEQDAAERDDPYLNAIARELSELSAIAGAGPPPQRAEVSRQLAALQEHAADAYRMAGTSTQAFDEIAGMFGEATRAAQDPAGPSLTAVGQELDSPTPPQMATADDGEAGPGANETTSDGQGAADPEIEEAEENVAVAPDLDPAAIVQDEVCYQEYENCAAEGADGLISDPGPIAEAAGGAPPNDIVEADQPGGMLIGPAANADRGEGILAGEGAQPLGDRVAERSEELAQSNDMLLPNQGDGEGQRIRIEAAPHAALSAVVEEGQLGGWPWTPAVEQPVARSLVPPALRNAMAQYFAPQERDE